jgi:uncharacterized membrane protein YhaH (DUF805 family)
MFNDYKLFWKNYFNFRGRTPRRGYWFVYLINTLIPLVIGLIFLLAVIILGGDDLSTLGGLAIFGAVLSGLLGIYGLATIIPNLSLSIRRLHDTGRRWPWILVNYLPALVAIALIVIVLIKGAASFNPSDLNSYGSLLGSLGSLSIIVIVVEPLLTFVCSIVWIILMVLATSPKAIGISTHDGTSFEAQPPAYAYGGASPVVANDQTAVLGSPYAAGAGYNAVAGTGTASIVGVKGMYVGYSFPVPLGEEVVIGRDAALAHIVIDQNAEKVSRKHISVRYEPAVQMYQVYDFSTNGTFKEDGVRLLTNTINSLPRNTVLSLGSAQNSIRLS